MSAKTFSEMYAEVESRDSYWSEVAILDFTSDLWQLMESQGLTKSELANRIGTSKAYITKVFSGNANFTIQTMVKLSRAVGGNLHVHVAEQEAQVRWFDIFDWRCNQVTEHHATVTEEVSPPPPSRDWGKLLELKFVDLNSEDRCHAA